MHMKNHCTTKKMAAAAVVVAVVVVERLQLETKIQ
jgi:hypothetical protein